MTKRDVYGPKSRPTTKLAKVAVDDAEPEETTRVRCPVCQQGTVTPEVAAMVNELLTVRDERQ